MSKLNLKGNLIVVKPIETEEKTEGGIILPEQYRKNQEAVGQIGEVVGIGDGVWVEKYYVDREQAAQMLHDHCLGPVIPVKKQFEKRPVDENIQVGTKVLYKKYTGMEVTVDGEKYLMMPEYEILGIVEE